MERRTRRRDAMALLLSLCSFARVPARDRFDDATRWAGGAHCLFLRSPVSLRFHAFQGSKNMSQAPIGSWLQQLGPDLDGRDREVPRAGGDLDRVSSVQPSAVFGRDRAADVEVGL